MKAAEQCLNSSTNSTPKKFSKHLEKQNTEPTNTLSRSPGKRKQVVTHLLQNFSPSSKSDEYKKTWLTCTPSNRIT